jgi:aerobic carbon-monoxide dehydrogenase large subunit
MSERVFGKRIKRNEDPRLLTGNALFVDDVNLSNMGHIAFLRSPYANARIRSIDVSKARQMEGVIAIFTAEDLGDYWKPAPLLLPPPPIKRMTFVERTHPPLAKNRVRYVGEPIVIVVAENRYLAEDALDLIDVDFEVLKPAVDMEQALQENAPLVHEELGSNVAAEVIQTKGDYEAAVKEADVVIRRRFDYDRGTAAAMENRGVVATWDNLSQRMTIWDTTQAPIPIRNGLAKMLGLSENQVRVIAPFIGGGFGPKVMMFYQEEIVVPWVSMQLNRPVKWIEDRYENFYATSQERSQIHEAEIALTKDGKILGVWDTFCHDSGAYDPYALTDPINSQCTLLGIYEVPNYYSEFKVVFTNKIFVTPFRGAGRQYGVFVMERLLDLAAKKLGIDRVEIRRRNLIPQDAFPYDNQIIYQDFEPLVYDSGNYEPVLNKTRKMIGWDEFINEEQPKMRAEGRHVGIGFVTYVEGTGIGPYEGARVQILESGKVSVVTGVGTQGQSHFTTFAQIAAEQLGVEVEDVEVVTGDTDLFHWGTGTFASRGAVVAGSAVHAAAGEVREKVFRAAAQKLGVDRDEIELVDGVARLKSKPARFVSLGVLANEANPVRGAVKPGTEPGLESTSYFGPERGATACGAHAMIVEADPETMELTIHKYVVVHDCGVVINPLVVDGQIHGGVAQGIGNAFYERLAYDEWGTIQNASLRDFLLPTALEVPKMDVGHEETPSPYNPLGMKGTGEAGAIPVGPLFASALEDALSDVTDFEILEIPLSHSRLWEILHRND